MMDKRCRRVLGASVAVLAAAAITAGAAQARELVYTSLVGAKHPVHTVGLEPFFKKVEEATGGSLTFALYPGGTLAGGKTTLNAIGNGTADMGLLADVYTPGDLPVSTLASDLAVLGKDARVMTGAVNQTLLIDCPECKQDYVEDGVLPLASYSLTPYRFMCTGAKIEQPADVVGKKVRATGAMGQLVAALQGTPVNITSSEIYEALQRGQADCALGPTPWLRTYTLWDHVKFVTASPVGTYHGTNFINIRLDTWKKLSDKEKKAITDNLAAATRAMAQVYEEDDESIVEEATAKGIQWVDGSAELRAAVDAFRDTDITRVKELAMSRGVKEPQPVVDTMVRNVAKWTGIVEDIGAGSWSDAQWDRYEAALRSEIFDRVKY